ncbi:MAG: glycerol-3-phosphate 1-O-acyltransferase PlsY [Salibacteraceae bacterium]
MLPADNIVALLLAYLLGSIPTAVWVGKVFYKIDVREYGSGNAGATNTFRVLGIKAGIPVLLFDVFKGCAAVSFVRFFTDYHPDSAAYVNFQLALGVCALLGHIFPIYVGFRGGKGIATLLGIMIAVHYQAALSAAGVFLVIFLSTRYVSLGSMLAAVSFPFIVIWVFHSRIPSLIIFSLFIAIMVLVTHQKNIERLLKKEESKANLSFKKRNKKQDAEND